MCSPHYFSGNCLLQDTARLLQNACLFWNNNTLAKCFAQVPRGPHCMCPSKLNDSERLLKYWSSMRCYEKSKNAKQCRHPDSSEVCSIASVRAMLLFGSIQRRWHVKPCRWKTGPIGHQDELKITLPRWIWLFRVSLNQEQIWYPSHSKSLNLPIQLLWLLSLCSLRREDQVVEIIPEPGLVVLFPPDMVAWTTTTLFGHGYCIWWTWLGCHVWTDSM